MFKELTFTQEIWFFVHFLAAYGQKKILFLGQTFEKIKSFFVSLLIAKRGKYQQSFINVSFFLLVATIWMVGPIIAENNPLIANTLNKNSNNNDSSVYSLYAMNIDNQTTTNFSNKPRDGLTYYQIQADDTLSSIAKKFDVSVDTIKWANDLDDDTINIGKTLKIPPVTGIVHQVESGDTIYTIAKKYHVDAQKIVNFPFNEYADQETHALTVGQTLFIPDGTPEDKAPIYQLVPQYFAGQAGSGSFIWPTTGMITQYPVWYHVALDIANPSSPPVIASDTGTVSYAGCLNWGYGCHVIVNHGNGFQTLYAHLSSYNVSVGQSVGKGDAIGTMGSTGNSTGTHLHFEIRQGGAPVNPLSYLGQ